MRPCPLPRRSRFAASLFVLACLLDAGCAQGPRPAIQSPPKGSLLTQDWTPVVVLVPASWKDARFEVSVDGTPVDDPLAIVRDRQSASKKGAQYLGTLDLEAIGPGRHRMKVVVHPSRWRPGHVLKTNFTVARAAGRISVRVVDGQDRPVSARVFAVGEEGPLPLADASAWRFDHKHREQERTAVFAVGGKAELALPAGRYTLVAARGLREDLGRAEVVVPDDTEVRLVVPRVLDTPGVAFADLHLHTGMSDDAYTPHRARAASFAASGLDVVALADHDRPSDPGFLLSALEGLHAVPLVLTGMELDVRSRAKKEWDTAHLTAGPLVADLPPPTRYYRSVGHAIDALHALQRRHPHPITGQDVLIQLAHPRGIHFRPDERSKDLAWALFNNKGFDRTLPVGEGSNAWMTERVPRTGTTALDVDAIEVVNRMSFTKYLEVRADWFALLDQGIVRTGTGNSDSHALAVEVVGWPCNLVSGVVGPDGVPDPVALIRGVREGRVAVSTGPVLELEAQAASTAGPGDVLATGGTPVQVRVRVRAAPWVPVHEVRLVKDGTVIERIDLGGGIGDPGVPMDRTLTFTVSPTQDAWLLAEAGWPEARQDIDVGGLYAVVAPDYVPLAFTNPVRLDVDGDGVWTPPGLP
ncbi:MAG: CehA/McbA family metallohydrolase [Deltaproteobacteria bacterium]|nr:CehA/McbA family metallohydrolase [Deltaproteobacteria bacterium]